MKKPKQAKSITNYAIVVLTLFALATVNVAHAQQLRKSVPAQKSTNSDFYTAPFISSEVDMTGDNASSIVDDSWIKWKVVGTFYNSDGIYAFDKWHPNGFYGTLGQDYVSREGSNSLSYLNVTNTSGYGDLFPGTHVVSISVDEQVINFWPFYHVDTYSYIKSHTYVVYVP